MEREIILPHNHHGDDCHKNILNSLPTEASIRIVAEALRQLGDPSRLRIFWLLCHTEECVADIAEYAGMSSPAVSHHLRLLKTSGLITSRRDGKEMLYKAADTELADELHHIIERIAEISCPG
ncbi:MAG: winged helix-turn-helix transcriptional regulator [Anaerolineaceae bacterium]|nr:winged helix-turn-helix transcriptional regulator [Anaerolineaceae bacterium]